MMTDPAASRPGTHLDPDRMADLLDGLLDAAAADEARAHLVSCAVCSGDFALISGEADLGALSELLPPVPIPQDVVTRVEAALYREPPLNGGSTSGAVGAVGAGGTAGAGTSAPAGPHAASHTSAATSVRPRRRGFRTALGALAGAALVIAGGFGVVTVLSSGNDSKSGSGSTAAGSAPSSESKDNSRAAGVAPDSPMSPQVGGLEPSASGTSTFNNLTIEQQAIALLGHQAMSPAVGTTAGVQCQPESVTSIAKPIAGGQTRYQGKAVWLLIYPKSGNPAVADVYVVAADGCTPDNPGQVLTEFEIPRP